MRWIDDLPVQGKRVLVRADLNVPLTPQGEVADDFRILSTLPTLRSILEAQGRLVLMSHLGNPEGKRDKKLSMALVAGKLAELLGVSVSKAKDCLGKEVREQAAHLQEGEVLLLENLRFHKQEQENDPAFAKELAQLADLYVSDAFGVLHREHASVVRVPKLLPSAGGLLLKKEIGALEKLLQDVERPMVAIVGGRKAESKAPAIDGIAELADHVLLGNVLAREIRSKNISFKHKDKLVFPADGIPPGKEYDIGPKAMQVFADKVREAKTLVWSGPLGRYEEEQYAQGSKAVAEAIGKEASYAVAGGGNLLDFLGRYNLRSKFDHISTGGSSMLAFLAGQELPGLKALGYYD